MATSASPGGGQGTATKPPTTVRGGGFQKQRGQTQSQSLVGQIDFIKVDNLLSGWRRAGSRPIIGELLGRLKIPEIPRGSLTVLTHQNIGKIQNTIGPQGPRGAAHHRIPSSLDQSPSSSHPFPTLPPGQATFPPPWKVPSSPAPLPQHSRSPTTPTTRAWVSWCREQPEQTGAAGAAD